MYKERDKKLKWKGDRGVYICQYIYIYIYIYI